MPPGLFFILKLHKAFQTALCKSMISKVMIKFLSKFQCQIPLQFYRTVENVETCDGEKVKSFDKYNHLFNLPILVTILFFHD